MQHVMDPSPGLLHSQVSPLRLRQQSVFGHLQRDLLWQNHMPVFKLLIFVSGDGGMDGG
jgi:hypothetical protein